VPLSACLSVGERRDCRYAVKMKESGPSHSQYDFCLLSSKGRIRIWCIHHGHTQDFITVTSMLRITQNAHKLGNIHSPQSDPSHKAPSPAGLFSHFQPPAHCESDWHCIALSAQMPSTSVIRNHGFLTHCCPSGHSLRLFSSR